MLGIARTTAAGSHWSRQWSAQASPTVAYVIRQLGPVWKFVRALFSGGHLASFSSIGQGIGGDPASHRGVPRRRTFRFSVGGMHPCAALALEMISMAGAGIRGLATRQWATVDELAHHSKAPAPTTKAEILRLWDEVTDQISALWPQIPTHRFDEIDTAFGQYEGRVFGLFLYWIDNEVHHRG